MPIERGQGLSFEPLGWRLPQHRYFTHNRLADVAGQARHGIEPENTSDWLGLFAPRLEPDLAIWPDADLAMSSGWRRDGRG